MSNSTPLTWLAERYRDGPATTVASVLAIAILPLVAPAALANYQEWHSLGQGGAFPHNVFGWLGQGMLAVLAHRDTLDVGLFRKPSVVRQYGQHGQESFLQPHHQHQQDSLPPPLPVRGGARPHVPAGFVVLPQRQTEERASDAMIRQMEEHMSALAAANQSLLKVDASVLEGVGNPALFVADGKKAHPLFGDMMKGEVVHRHHEGSSHMTMSLADAEEVIRCGWGQRFRLGGIAVVPATYIMVYAPRNEAELEVWKQLVMASVRFILADEHTEVKDV